MREVSIVIVNWNTGELLAGCLQALRALPPEEQQVISGIFVVDNASTDDSLEQARAAALGSDGLIEWLALDYNAGFTAANNLAIKRVSGGHVLLLNPDTEVQPGALVAMLSELKKHSRVGIVGPKLLNKDGSTQGSIRPFPQMLDFGLYMLKLGRLRQVHQEQAYNYDKEQVVDQVMGAAFLIRDTVLKTIGGLDEGFFMWFEEVDYCRRAASAGWQTYYTPRAEVIHYQGVSFSQLLGFRKTVPWLRSCLYYAKKHLCIKSWLLLMLLAPLSLLLSIPASLWHAYVRNKKEKYL